MSWLQTLQSLQAVIGTIPPESSWGAVSGLSRRLHEIEETLSADLAILHEEADFIFSADLDPAVYTRQVTDLFQRWHRTGKAPSLCAIAIFGMQNSGMDADDPLAPAVMMAGLLGEVDSSLPYHSNMHFRKVLLQTISLAAVHNDMYDGQVRELQRDHVALLIVAACIHDLGHDGKSNTAGGTYMPSRAEKRSFGLAKPYLAAAGLDEAELEDILVMLIATDVSSLEKRASPAEQMKQAYRYHFLKGAAVSLDGGLEILQKRADLVTSSLLLHEADLSTSAGLEYGITTFETALHREESAGDRARPSHVVSFLEKICGGMLSDAGKKLYAANMQTILQKAKADQAAGDLPYPESEESDFLLGFDTGLATGTTIN